MAYGPTSIGGYMALSPATKENIGGVKIGEGINVADDGTINVESAPAGYVMTKEWSGSITPNISIPYWLKIGEINNIKPQDTIEISTILGVGFSTTSTALSCEYNIIFSKKVDASNDPYSDCSLLSYATGSSTIIPSDHYFSALINSDGSIEIFINLSSMVQKNVTTNLKVFTTVKTSNVGIFNYLFSTINGTPYDAEKITVYDTPMMSITPSGASKVNNFTFKAQTSDPGAGSSLETGTVLFVYS